MKWLDEVAEEVIRRVPSGEILIESGVSPSGIYHVGTLREVLTCDAVLLELRNRGRQAKHIHYVDDLDPLRKIPANVSVGFEKYLGQPLCDVPAPDGSGQSYADFFLNDFLGAAEQLHLNMEVIRSHEKYRSGFMVPALEKALANLDKIRQIIEKVSGRRLDPQWAPIQVLEDEYLKSRRFVSIDTKAKSVTYLGPDGNEVTIGYQKGEVKLNWRVDWPARWWLLGVDAEPFGRDHATKGGSYDTGAALSKEIFETEPPLPIPYDFINLTGETKKMSKSAGNTIAISEMTKVLPAEVVRYFTFRYSPGKQLFFDQVEGVTKLIDDYSALLAKPDKTEAEKKLLELSSVGKDSVISSVPFSHLASSYQASLKDPQKTLAVISRTEHQAAVKNQQELIVKELQFIDRWLGKWAPEDVKFELADHIDKTGFSDKEKDFLASLGNKIAEAPANADGEWFHKAVYELQGLSRLEPKQMFGALYRALIGKESGPRAGWFLSILPRDWLIKRLRLES